MARGNVDPYTPTKYYRRKRTYTMADGSKLETMVTRYTYEYGRKPYTGPRGGRRYKTIARSLYYAHGMLYKACNLETSEGKYTNSLAPFDGQAWDCHVAQTHEQGMDAYALECVEGVIVSVTDESGAGVWDYFDNTREELEHLLDLAPISRKQMEREERKRNATDLPVAADAVKVEHMSVPAPAKDEPDAYDLLDRAGEIIAREDLASPYTRLASAATAVALAAYAGPCDGAGLELTDAIADLLETVKSFNN